MAHTRAKGSNEEKGTTLPGISQQHQTFRERHPWHAMSDEAIKKIIEKENGKSTAITNHIAATEENMAIITICPDCGKKYMRAKKEDGKPCPRCQTREANKNIKSKI